MLCIALVNKMGTHFALFFCEVLLISPHSILHRSNHTKCPSLINTIYYIYILPLFLNKSIPRIRASQTFLSLTNFIEKSNNIYDIK